MLHLQGGWAECFLFLQAHGRGVVWQYLCATSAHKNDDFGCTSLSPRLAVKSWELEGAMGCSFFRTGRTNVLSIRIGDTETRFVLNWCFLETIALRMEWWTFLWIREGGGAYGKAICFLSDKKWTNRCLLWKTNGIFSSLCAVDRFFNLIDILLNYGITLLGINLGYCLYHEKFTLFRRFLKMGCPLPSHQELPEFLSYAVKALEGYKEWLPYLLLAGFNPVNLLYRFW